MQHNPEKHHRRSIRLKGYDYTNTGAYFITICTHQKVCLLGDIVNGEMQLNAYGRVVEFEWFKTAELRGNIVLDAFVIMPNHVHGTIIITRRGVLQYAPTQYAPTQSDFRSPSQTIGAIVRGFKSAATKQINETRHMPGAPIWQRNYYEHIIRNEKELNQIRKYIINNPLQWELDKENPKNQETDL